MENDQSRTCPVCHQNDAVQKISAVVSAPEEPSSSRISPFMTYLGYALGIFGVLWLIGFLIFGEVDLNVVLTAGLTIGVFIYFVYLRRRYQSTEYPTLKAAWDKAIERWDRLYYCDRDDIVFDPETNETCSKKDVKQFVYETQEESA